MKRFLLIIGLGSILASGLVAVGPAPAHAIDRVVQVHGFAYPATLGYSEHVCPGGAQAPPFVGLYRRGGARGTHATGFGIGGPGGTAGVLGQVASPTTLSAVTVQVFFPEPEVNGDLVDGYFVAQYYATNGKIYDGYYPLTVSGHGSWVSSPNLAVLSLGWTERGTGNTGSGTVAAFTAARGGGTVMAGFEFGCDGRDYFVDDLRLSSSAGTTTYDFEGARSRSYITANPTHDPKHPNSHLVRDITRINLVHGQNHYLLGDSEGVADGFVTDDYLAGTAGLYRRAHGSSSYRYARAAGYTPTTYATFEIQPSRRTSYQIRTKPTDPTFEDSSSKVLVVTVQRRMRARIADTRITKGQRIVVSGHLMPRDRGVPVALQRRFKSGWRTIARTTSVRDGKYRVAVRAGSTGTWTIRIRIPTAKGVRGNVSRVREVRVIRAPSPAPQPVVYTTPIPATHSVVDIKRPMVNPAGAPSTGEVAPRRTISGTRIPASAMTVSPRQMGDG